MSKQRVVSFWCKENNCTPETKIYPLWMKHMKKWDNSFAGYYGSGTYDDGVMQMALYYAKKELQ